MNDFEIFATPTTVRKAVKKPIMTNKKEIRANEIRNEKKEHSK